MMIFLLNSFDKNRNDCRKSGDEMEEEQEARIAT
jgi:hypothetical protein